MENEGRKETAVRQRLGGQFENVSLLYKVRKQNGDKKNGLNEMFQIRVLPTQVMKSFLNRFWPVRFSITWPVLPLFT